MLKPIDMTRYVHKNYQIMLKDYNIYLFSFTFIVIPCMLAFLVSVFIGPEEITNVILSSISFFSIIVGFLINILILLLNVKNEDKGKIDKDIEKLRKHLSFNILNCITFGIILIILILFYGNYNFIITVNFISINLSAFLLFFLFFHISMLILNIIRKFGVYIETKYK